MSEFKIENVGIAGAPTIEFRFEGAVGKAELGGATLDAEAIDEHSADIRVRDAGRRILADLTVRKLATETSITATVTAVGSALLWSHHRWLQAGGASAEEPKASAEVPAAP